MTPPIAIVKKRRFVVALAGNPNSGKTTVFNGLTGARQHVANYPGVTVERKEGRLLHRGHEITVVDLPGTYSLTAFSVEEIVARNFLIDEHPDVVVNIVDASNLERNLYLTVQLIELGVPLLVVLNMSDLAESRGVRIDAASLSGQLGTPVLRMVGHKELGIEELKDALVGLIVSGVIPRTASLGHGPKIEQAIAPLLATLEQEMSSTGKPPAHCLGCPGGCLASPSSVHSRTGWWAVKLLEDDEHVRRHVVHAAAHPEPILAAIDTASREIERLCGDVPEVAIADHRYARISRICLEAVNTSGQKHRFLSDRIDGVVTNRLLGIPVFLGMMYLVFKLTFTLGHPLMHQLERLVAWLGERIGELWPAGSDSALKSLVVDGLLGGVGGVLVFLPNILLLFLAIGLLEDTGYMARAAFLIDRLMYKIGLHGKSFIPMLIGFGCTVPAILGTRVLENRRDRLTTMLVLPLVSCGARLPIYTLLISAMFPETWQAPVLWSIYLIGIVLAVVVAKILRSSVFQGEVSPFVMELPPYRLPTARGLLLQVGQRGWHFLQKAGTMILAFSAILWAMTTYPRVPESQIEGLTPAQSQQARLSYSVTGRLGRALEPVMRPIGFDWKTSTAMIGALAAKEMFVAQLSIVYSLGEKADAATEVSTPASNDSPRSLQDTLRREYTPLQAFCIMLFCLVSIPCTATFTTIWKESGSWKWAVAQWVGLTLLAYAVTLAVFQLGAVLGIGTG